MTTLTEKIRRDARSATKERDRARAGTLRMLAAALHNGEIEAGRPLTEEEEHTILRRQLKQREESAEAFYRAGREERAAAESAEAEIVRRYLPEPLSAEELETVVERAVEQTGASGMANMGEVMGRAVELAGGRATGRELAALVRRRLQG